MKVTNKSLFKTAGVLNLHKNVFSINGLRIQDWAWGDSFVIQTDHITNGFGHKVDLELALDYLEPSHTLEVFQFQKPIVRQIKRTILGFSTAR